VIALLFLNTAFSFVFLRELRGQMLFISVVQLENCIVSKVPSRQGRGELNARTKPDNTELHCGDEEWSRIPEKAVTLREQLPFSGL